MDDPPISDSRRYNMAQIRSKDTKPEKIVRSMLHRLGYRFRLHRKDIPGNPDIVLPKYRTVIFVHGCFWHRHQGCKYCYTPKTRVDFWEKKFADNIRRDKEVQKMLSDAGWNIIVVWECEVNFPDNLTNLLVDFLKNIDQDS
jgi:DNA mismatch endonuclease (patch repair protein)